MKLFEWDNSFQTGSKDVDEQHLRLINIVNQFGELIAHSTAASEDIEKVCAELMDYASYHFNEEDRLIESLGLDRRHIAQHRQQHNDLIAEINPLRQLATVGNLSAARYMFDFLVNWLVFHILGTDMLMARQIDAVRQGTSPEDAYISIEIDSGQANGRLLNSVKKLLMQLSSRNKELIELNESLEQKVRERTSQLIIANNKLKDLASKDGLTGLFNRRAFMEEANNMFKLAKRHKRPLSLLMVDADNFKNINGTYGHQIGDQVLIRLSRIMEDCLRVTDVVGRIGGEEFAVLLPETNIEQTVELTSRLLNAVRNAVIETTETSVSITVSIGVATTPPHADDFDTIMKIADQALYQAKNSGRDRCCGF